MTQDTRYSVEVHSPVGTVRMELTGEAAMAVVTQLFPLLVQPAPTAAAPTTRHKRERKAIATCRYCGARSTSRWALPWWQAWV